MVANVRSSAALQARWTGKTDQLQSCFYPLLLRPTGEGILAFGVGQHALNVTPIPVTVVVAGGVFLAGVPRGVGGVKSIVGRVSLFLPTLSYPGCGPLAWSGVFRISFPIGSMSRTPAMDGG